MRRTTFTINFLLVALSAIVVHAGDMDLNLLPETTSPGGRCMDGSMSGYYIRDGDPDLFVIYLKGGGACTTKEICDKRVGTDNGGSDNWKDTKTGSTFQSASCDDNPDFCNATAVYIPYCSSDTHRGTRDVPSNETWGYYFNGHLNFKAIIEVLIADKGLSQSGNKVLLSGASAGAVGTIFNIDWLANRLPGVTVKGAPTAGWFFPAALDSDLPAPFNPSDYPHFANGISGNDQYDAYMELGEDFELFDLWKFRDMLPAGCIADQEEDFWFACSSIHYAYPYITSSLFNIHTQYDGNQVYAQGMTPQKASSLDEADTIERYVEMWGEATRASLQKILNNETNIIKPQPDGVFSASCITHATSTNLLIDGLGYMEIVHDWFFEIGDYDQYYRLIETCPSSDRELPCNVKKECRLVMPEKCPIVNDIYNRTFYLSANNACWQIEVFEGGTLEGDFSDPTCSNDQFNSQGVFSLFDYSDENIAHFKVGDRGYSGTFAFKATPLAEEPVLEIDSWRPNQKKYGLTAILPSCTDPTPVTSMPPSMIPSLSPSMIPSLSPSMIPSVGSPSLCSIEDIYDRTFYLSVANACWRVEVFEGGTLEGDFSDPNCSNDQFNSRGVFSIFESGSGNSAYFAEGQKGYSGTFSFEESTSVSEQEFQLTNWNPSTKEYDILFILPDCAA